MSFSSPESSDEKPISVTCMDGSTMLLTRTFVLPIRTRVPSSSSSYPSEGMRSPDIAPSPPPTAGKRVFSNLSRLGHLAFLRSESDMHLKVQDTPGITVKKEVSVQVSQRTDETDEMLGNTTCISHGTEPQEIISPQPSTAPTNADHGRHLSDLDGIYDSLTAPHVRGSSDFSDVPESRASITCLPRNSGNYGTPEHGAGLEAGPARKRSLGQKMKASKAVRTYQRVRASLRRRDGTAAPSAAAAAATTARPSRFIEHIEELPLTRFGRFHRHARHRRQNAAETLQVAGSAAAGRFAGAFRGAKDWVRKSTAPVMKNKVVRNDADGV